MSGSDLAPERIASVLGTSRFGRSLDVRAETRSTMDDVRAALEAGAPDGHVVVADRQTQGRGSHGRTWESPAGMDLYLSIGVRPTFPSDRLALLTLATGLAVAETVDDVLGGVPRSRVKWPNDVHVDDRKCAGILVESRSQGDAVTAVVGIGLNVRRQKFPRELASHATSLALLGARDEAIDRAAVLARLLARVESWTDRLGKEGPLPIVEALDRRLAYRGARVRLGTVTGTVERIASNGAIVLRCSGHSVECIAGELVPLQKRR